MTLTMTQRLTWVSRLSFLGVILTLGHAFAEYSGITLCPTDGCKAVESLTKLPAAYISLIGATYFMALRTLASKSENEPWKMLLVLAVTAGLSAEGVLVGTQLFVVKTLCVYCIVVFMLVTSVWIVLPSQQRFPGLAAFLASLSVMWLLNFGQPTQSIYELLENGRAAVELSTKAGNGSKTYLIVSDDCTHCKEVIENLDPTKLDKDWSINLVTSERQKTDSKIQEALATEFEPRNRLQHDPSANLAVLKSLKLTGVPALITVTGPNLQILYGKSKILQSYGKSVTKQPAVLSAEQKHQSTDDCKSPASRAHLKALQVPGLADESCKDH